MKDLLALVAFVTLWALVCAVVIPILEGRQYHDKKTPEKGGNEK